MMISQVSVTFLFYVKGGGASGGGGVGGECLIPCSPQLCFLIIINIMERGTERERSSNGLET
jgi:hypothetical protein